MGNSGLGATPPEHRLLFLLAGTAGRRATRAAEIAALAREADPALLQTELERRRLLGLLGGRLADLGLAPAPLAAAVAAHRLRARAVGLATLAETDAVLAALGRQGIRARALKGAALAEAAHGDVGARESGDLDVLVAPEHLHAAAKHLMSQGYAAPRDRLGPDGLPALHLRLEHATRLPVELHWRISWYDEAFSRALLAHPTPRDEAAALLVFYARDGFYGLRLVADLAAYVDRHGPAPLTDHAARYPGLRRTLETATLVAERTAGIPLATWWPAPPVPDHGQRLAMRLSNWSQAGDRDQLAANMTLVDGLLTPRGQHRAFARRVVDAVPRAEAPAHAAKFAARATAALWRVRRSWWSPAPPAPRA